MATSMNSPSSAWPATARQLSVGDLRIDLRYRRVHRPDQNVELPQRMFDLLLLFLAEPYAMHTRDELFRRVWSGVIVEDANLSQSVWMLRKALGHQRKNWIRTVAKSGYVFEPPTCVAVIEDSKLVELHTDAAIVSDASITIVPDEREFLSLPPKKMMPRWRVLTAIGAVFLLLIGAAFYKEAKQPVLPIAPLSIALMDVEDPATSLETRWPTALSHAWLEWKFSLLPEVRLLSQAQMAADVSAATPTKLILLTSGTSPKDPSRIFVRASFESGGKSQLVQLDGRPEQVAELVDTLSRRVLDQLVPTRAQQSWPALKLDSAAAKRYVDMLHARQTRQWRKTAQIGEELVVRAPEFGLLHLQLGETHAILSEMYLAQKHAATARLLLKPLPMNAMEVVNAQLLAISQKHDAAITAYTKLSSRYPEQPVFATELSRALIRAQRPDDAIKILSKPFWEKQSVSIQITRLINLASCQLMVGDPKRARINAQAADKLAQTAGKGWEFERGFATLNLAIADSYETGGNNDMSLFEDAAKHFEMAGDSMRAMRARFLGETSRPMTTSSEHLDALLAKARAAGFRQLEFDALRIVAFQQYRAGDFPKYRLLLGQAMAVANVIGDTAAQHMLELDFLNEDLLTGNFASADQRIKRLQKSDVQGESALWVDQFVSSLAYYRGNYPEALAALDHGQKLAQAGLGSGAAAPASAAKFACMRAAIVLTQGDPTRARAGYASCNKSVPYDALQAQIGIAETDLLSGDRETAVRGLESVLKQLPSISNAPARWQLSLQIATLMTRAREIEISEKLYSELLPLLQSANYDLLEASARIGMAENAMVRSDQSVAQAQMDAARPLLPPGTWVLSQRMDMLQIAIDRANGNALSAKNRLVELERLAHRHGDVLAQIQAHSLMSVSMTGMACSKEQRAALIAESGLRGASADWLIRLSTEEVLLELSEAN